MDERLKNAIFGGVLPIHSKNLSLTCYPAEKDEPIYINVKSEERED